MSRFLTSKGVCQIVSRRTGAPRDLVYSTVEQYLRAVRELLEHGYGVRLPGLGVLDWRLYKELTLDSGGWRNSPRKCPDRLKLKFTPAVALRGWRPVMEKYGVELDDSKTKEAAKKHGGNKCPECQSELDEGGACPKHGTEPFEKKREDRQG